MRSQITAALQRTIDLDPVNATRIQSLAVRPSCRILVVDDDELVRGRLAAFLSASQYEVEEAATGVEALRVLKATQCQIVLTDWQMPNMDGLALCRRVRREIQDTYIYVLMLTIRGTEHDMLTGLAAGVDDYVVKGASIEEILARLEIGRRITQAKTPPNAPPQLTCTDQMTGVHDLACLVQHLPRAAADGLQAGRRLDGDPWTAGMPALGATDAYCRGKYGIN